VVPNSVKNSPIADVKRIDSNALPSWLRGINPSSGEPPATAPLFLFSVCPREGRKHNAIKNSKLMKGMKNKHGDHGWPACAAVWTSSATPIHRNGSDTQRWSPEFAFIPFIKLAVLYRVVLSSFTRTNRNKNRRRRGRRFARWMGLFAEPAWECVAVDSLDVSDRAVFTLLGTTLLGSYGWSLFVALPFCLGLFAVLLHSYMGHGLRTCMNVALLPLGIIGAVLLVVELRCDLYFDGCAIALGWRGLAAHWGIPSWELLGRK